MRIAIQLGDDALRVALGDLLTEAGHEVDAGPADRVAAALLIRQESGGEWPGIQRCVLSLRPGPAGRPDPDPSQALERVLRTGGEATWASPFDPGRLLSVLARVSGGAGPASSEDPGPGYPLLESAPDPWYVLDPPTGRVVWSNPAARRRAAVTRRASGGQPPGALDALARPEGRCAVPGPDGGASVVWWTDARRRRVLGLLPLVAAPLGSEARNLHTLADIGRVSATLAHEIRNPLASLASAIDLLDGPLSQVERDEVARMARARLAQMKTMLDDTLRLARPFRGPPVAVDLAGVVASATAIARATPSLQGIVLTVDLPSDPLTGRGYPEPLQQALLNVLLNAAEAQGGVGSIRIELRREGRLAILRVSDQGPGVEEAQRHRVFEPFYTTKPAGTGLGLAYVRRVAAAGGGGAAFEPTERGACLRIEVPLDGEGEAEGPWDPPRGEDHGR